MVPKRDKLKEKVARAVVEIDFMNAYTDDVNVLNVFIFRKTI